MNSLDVIIVVVLLAYAVSGYFQGFVVNLVATVGLLVGGLLAVSLVPKFFEDQKPSLTTSLIALLAVVASAAIGQGIGTYVGTDIRKGLTWRPLRSVDAVGGSALSIVAVLCAGWALGYSVSGSQIPYLSNAVRDSSILRSVNHVMPDGATDVLNAFNKVLDTNLFPRYLEPFENEKITDVGPPSEGTLRSPGIEQAAKSTVKILGSASCNRGIEGSGFAYAPDRVMTNAHVVAGVAHPFVIKKNHRLPAKVVLFDPKLDVAVLAVNNLEMDPLDFDLTGKAGDEAAVLGFPENGPFDERAARIRRKQELQSPDIYNKGQSVRETFSIRSRVRLGNSGGPLVSSEGNVYGVIFAASVTDESTGYALTAQQVSRDAARGRTATAGVSTGKCA